MKLLSSTIIAKACFNISVRSICKKINTVHKRAYMLENMLKNRDKRKHWHFELLQNNAKAQNVFEGLSRPSRRQSVLNTLFIENISDVLSTGDVPEIFGLGLEITGIKISPCNRIVNVYWRATSSNQSISHEDIGMILNENAFKIRSELTGRNVLGRVPRITFVRDITDSYVSDFERALKEADMGPENERMIEPEEVFTTKRKNIFKFKTAKVSEKDKKATEENVVQPVSEDPKSLAATTPKPPDMRTDVFGLDRDSLMRIVTMKKRRPKSTYSGHVIASPEWDHAEKPDLFSQIPGTSIHDEKQREQALKQFYVERKKLRLQKSRFVNADNNDSDTDDYFQEGEVHERVSETEDFFVEEEPTERV